MEEGFDLANEDYILEQSNFKDSKVAENKKDSPSQKRKSPMKRQ